MIPLALILLVISLVFLFFSNRQRAQAGLPTGRVVYSDTSRWNRTEKPLYDPLTGLTGKPDYLVEQNGVLLPVEVKSGWAPSVPHESHLYQLAAYCVLVQHTTGKRPPYGLIHYRNRTFAVDFTPELEKSLADVLVEIRRQERLGTASRSHEDPSRCAHCGYRKICEEKLQ